MTLRLSSTVGFAYKLMFFTFTDLNLKKSVYIGYYINEFAKKCLLSKLSSQRLATSERNLLDMAKVPKTSEKWLELSS